MNNDYISDEELLKLIREVEEGAMLKAPVYLKGRILQEIQKEEALRCGGDSARHPIQEYKKDIRKQLLVYKIKVIGAMAAAIIILFLLPVPVQDGQTGTETDVQGNRIFECWNEASGQLLQQMGTISGQLLHPADTLKEYFDETDTQTQP